MISEGHSTYQKPDIGFLLALVLSEYSSLLNVQLLANAYSFVIVINRNYLSKP